MCWEYSKELKKFAKSLFFFTSLSDSEEDEAREEIMTRFNLKDIHQLDVDSREFKKLPKDIQVGEN